jgi:hypothetical protein
MTIVKTGKISWIFVHLFKIIMVEIGKSHYLIY